MSEPNLVPGYASGIRGPLAGIKMTCSEPCAQRLVCAYDPGVPSAEATTSISRRGEAQRTIEPDEARLYSTLSATRDSKSSALSEVQAALPAIVAELTSLGGEVLTAESTRAPLTWPTQSIRTTRRNLRMTRSAACTGRRGATRCR